MIDVLDPYILLVHQGIVESLFIEDMSKRGKTVRRNTAFESYDTVTKTNQLQINCRTNVTRDKKTYLTQYLVGCKLGARFPGPLAGCESRLTGAIR